MIYDLERPNGSPPSQSSVCIVGAGAAGISLAVELAKQGVSVHLLESGGLHGEPATQALYESEVSGLRHNGIHTGRFRVLGGTTTQWGGQILELDDQDFEARPWVPDSGWPFAKAELTPFYRRALEIEGLSKAIADDRAVWKMLNIAAPDFGATLIPFFTRWCPEPDFGRLFASPLRDNPRISVFLHANASEVVLSADRQNIAGIHCRTLAGNSQLFTAERYVFCAGGIETARLLLQPVGDSGSLPWNASGLTGRYFQDHIDSTLIEVLPRSRRQFHRWFDNVYRSGIKYHPKIKLSFAEQRRSECLNIGATCEFHTSRSERLAEFRQIAKSVVRGDVSRQQMLRLVRGLPDAGLLLRQALRFKLQGRAFNPDELGIFLRIHCEQAPNRESRVVLTSARDALGMLKARLDWRITDLEIATMRHFARTVETAFASVGFGEIRVNPDLKEGGSGASVALR